MTAYNLEILIACLRRVDGGDPADSVLRDYPEDAGWLREHLLVSDALQMAAGPSAEKKAGARQSLLSAVARWDPPPVSLRPRFGLAMTHVALIVVGCLALTTAGAAAAGSQVNLRSVAGDVFETLVEPLPLPDEPREDSVRFEQEDGAARDSAAGIGRADEKSVDDGLDDDEASAVSDATNDGEPTTQDGLSTEPDPAGGDLPAGAGTPVQPKPETPAPTPVPESSPPPAPAPKPTPTPVPPTDPPQGNPPGNGGHPPGDPPGLGSAGHPPGDPPDGENRGKQPGNPSGEAGPFVQNPGPNGSVSNHSNEDPSNANDCGSGGSGPKTGGRAG